VQGQGLYVAYVGDATRLKNRVTQHLVRSDSSITTGTSAATLKPEYVTEVRWWEDGAALHAAELVAFDVLEPVLRSRGAIPKQVQALYEDEGFVTRMRALFEGEPAGRLVILTLVDALARIQELEKRVGELERKLGAS